MYRRTDLGFLLSHLLAQLPQLFLSLRQLPPERLDVRGMLGDHGLRLGQLLGQSGLGLLNLPQEGLRKESRRVIKDQLLKIPRVTRMEAPSSLCKISQVILYPACTQIPHHGPCCLLIHQRSPSNSLSGPKRLTLISWICCSKLCSFPAQDFLPSSSSASSCSLWPFHCWASSSDRSFPACRYQATALGVNMCEYVFEVHAIAVTVG